MICKKTGDEEMKNNEFNEMMIRILNECTNQEQVNIIISALDRNDVDDLMNHVICEIMKQD